MKTSRRDFLKSVGATVAGSALGAGAAPRASFSSVAPNGPNSSKPLNILFIMSDQHNAHAVGCYGGGFGPAPEMETPNLDRLASEGVMFTNSYCAQGQCCPSRYSLFTGQWPHTHGLRWNQIWEPRESVTLPQLARKAGYKTATIGKHHFYWLYGNFDDLGFDTVIENSQYNAHCSRAGQKTYSNSTVNYRMSPMPSSLAATGYTYNANDYHTVGYWTEQTIQYLRDRAADQEPFFCVYSFFLPHTPVLPTGPPGPPGTPMTPGEIDWANKYDPDGITLPPNINKVATTARLQSQQDNYNGVGPNSNGVDVSEAQWKQILAYYYGLTSQIDWNIGRVLDELDTLGLAENTLVIYTADHGEMASEMSCWTKGGGMMDALNRVPLIMRLPGVLPAGKVTGEFANGVDLAPTMLELSGIPAPDEVRNKIDGRSLVELMQSDEVPADWPPEVFSEFCHPSIGLGLAKMIRTKTAKYCWDQNRSSPQEEFYDMANDPYEIDNLINDPTRQAEIQNLRDKLAAFWNNEQGHAPLYLTAENTSPNANALPKASTEPSPANNATGVARDVNPSWLRNPACESQAVYFGATDPPPLFTTVDGADASFNPGTLPPNTKYYWKIEGTNRNGTTDRVSTWNFTTTSGGGGEPGLATTPTPAHRGEDVSLSPALTWTPGAGALSHNVYFGTENPPPFQGNQASASFDPGSLKGGTNYFWRIDEVNAAGTTEGDVWRFETDSSTLPEPATAPNPTHLENGIDKGVSLSFIPGAGAVSHDIYFGTENPPPFQRIQASSSFDPGPLQPATTYFWQVNEVNADGTTPGFVWRFTTTDSTGAGKSEWWKY